MKNCTAHKYLIVLLICGGLLFFAPLFHRTYTNRTIFIISSHHALQQRELKDLKALQWPVPEVAPYPTRPNSSIPQKFEPKMSRGQRATQVALFSTFVNLMQKLGLDDQWMLYGGTLLGSFRHHDMIPWDDDFDILVNVSVREVIRAEFKSLEPNYNMVKAGSRDKVFAKLIVPPNKLEDLEGSRRTNAYDWGWPFLDLTYYTENATHLTEIAWSYGRSYAYLKKDTFPLIYRPLGFVWAPAPRNTLAFLRQSYPGDYNCVAPWYSHVKEGAVKGESRPCDELAHRYAFVRQLPPTENLYGTHDLEWINETLGIKDDSGQWKDIHQIQLLATRCAAGCQSFQLYTEPFGI